MTTFKALFHDREEMRTAGASVQEMRQRYSSMIKEEYLLVELAAILGDDIEAAWEKVRVSDGWPILWTTAEQDVIM